MRLRSASLGFTLLEASVTLAVLAILAVAALPAAAERAERNRLQAVAEALATDLGNARLEAAQSGQPLHLSVAVGKDWCWSVSTVPGCTCGQPTGCQLQHVSSANHPGLALADGHDVALDPAGTAPASRIATFTSRSGEQLRVDLTPLGRTRLCVAASRTPAAWRLPAC